MTHTVAVLGSINLDTTYHMARFPQPGETLAVDNKSSAPGGKGANQAVACAQAGADTHFIGMVGADNEGKFMLEALENYHVKTDFIGTNLDKGTGSAVITLDAEGQNEIMVYGGANQAMTVNDLAGIDSLIKNTDFIIAQFETPQAVALEAFKLAKKYGVITVLNPAPASEILPELLTYTDIIAPNETESALLTGIKLTDQTSMEQTAAYFKEKGIANLLITLGEAGVFYATKAGSGIVPAFKVKAVDTTAAGDTFIGSLIARLDKDLSNITDAITYAQKASSIAVQRIGAMPSIPSYEEVMADLENKELF